MTTWEFTDISDMRRSCYYGFMSIWISKRVISVLPCCPATTGSTLKQITRASYVFEMLYFYNVYIVKLHCQTWKYMHLCVHKVFLVLLIRIRFRNLNSQFSILNSQFSILNSQSSILNSQFSILNSQFSIFNCYCYSNSYSNSYLYLYLQLHRILIHAFFSRILIPVFLFPYSYSRILIHVFLFPYSYSRILINVFLFTYSY